MIYNVSLRGTLAEDYIKEIIENEALQRGLDNYVFQLIESNDPTLLKFTENGITLIGKKSERGLYSPDW
jgi:hypothetical protein